MPKKERNQEIVVPRKRVNNTFSRKTEESNMPNGAIGQWEVKTETWLLEQGGDYW